MSTAGAVAALVAISLLLHASLAVALARADRRAERTRARPGTPTQEGLGSGRLGDPPSDPRTSCEGGAMHAEVGGGSGRAYPPDAVVVGYNGKEHSRVAVVWAAREAVRRDRPLVVLHAANYPGMTGPPGPGLLHRDPGALDAAEEVTGLGVIEAVAARPGLDVVGATEVTSAVRALTDASRDASLVVVGSRGHGRLARALLGSVSSAVASRATAPVAVVTDVVRPSWSGRHRSRSDPGVSSLRIKYDTRRVS
jgi:nucleotide-binding universal stress UspA family protein